MASLCCDSFSMFSSSPPLSLHSPPAFPALPTGQVGRPVGIGMAAHHRYPILRAPLPAYPQYRYRATTPHWLHLPNLSVTRHHAARTDVDLVHGGRANRAEGVANIAANYRCD